MKIKYLGTAAAEGIPAIFCECANCKRPRMLGGKNIRTRSQAIIDFEADGYKIMPIKAEHNHAFSPVVFVIEKDGKSIFYANDSSEYSTESIECLKSLKKPIDVVSFDCTEACNHATYVGHLSLERFIALRKKLIDENIAYIDTLFVLNHFSHNGANVVYDDFVKIAA